MDPIFFSSPAELRKWFEKNHANEKELLVGYYKRHSDKPTITWPQSVDEALCFGWIDGVRRSLNDEQYTIRFTPRKPKSNWSSVNIKKVEVLTRLGLMKPAGIQAFKLREEKKSEVYSFEQKTVQFPAEFLKLFKSNKKAWTYFKNQAPSYQKATTWWVISAKQKETQLKRLKTLIEDSENGKYIDQMRWGRKKV